VTAGRRLKDGNDVPYDHMNYNIGYILYRKSFNAAGILNIKVRACSSRYIGTAMDKNLVAGKNSAAFGSQTIITMSDNNSNASTHTGERPPTPETQASEPGSVLTRLFARPADEAVPPQVETGEAPISKYWKKVQWRQGGTGSRSSMTRGCRSH
jgi:hypothetical protein